jgi:hypothetical protein
VISGTGAQVIFVDLLDHLRPLLDAVAAPVNPAAEDFRADAAVQQHQFAAVEFRFDRGVAHKLRLDAAALEERPIIPASSSPAKRN